MSADEELSVTAQTLVAVLFKRAEKHNRYRLRATMVGNLQLICKLCSEDVYGGHVIWSTANKQRQNYSLTEMTNLADDHEQMVHGKEASHDGGTSTETGPVL